MPKITNDDKYPLVTPALTDEIMIISNGVVKKALLSGISGSAGETVVVNTTDTTITLTTADLNKILVIENANPVVVNMPSVGSGDVGSTLGIRKRGVGTVTVNMADSDTVADGTSTIVADLSTEIDAALNLLLETETAWGFSTTPLGLWSTS